MKRLTYYYKTENTFDDPASRHQFQLRCMPRMSAYQSVLSASVLLSPDTGYTQQRDAFGNVLQIGLINEAHTHFSYTAIGEVETNFALQNRSALHPMYRYPTALTSVNEDMAAIAAPFAQKEASLETARQFNEIVFNRIQYMPNSTSVDTAADAVFTAGAGVCQDYAHVLIALLKRAGIPARYACGLSVGEGVTHAWVQAYLGGSWIGLDPTRNTLITEDYVTFAVGRDAGDCPIDRGIYIGAANHQQTVFMRLMEQ